VLSLQAEDVLAAMTGRYADFYSQHTPLKPAGGKLRGPCPLHGGTGPNFIVNPETGLWHCFSQCGEGGDVLCFLQKKCGLSFPEALAAAAAFAGLSSACLLVPKMGTVKPQTIKPKPPLIFLDLALAEELHGNLMRAPKVCRWLLERRGLTEDTLRRFQVGLLPAESDLHPAWDKEPYWRICFPVFDAQGRLTNIRRHLFAYKPELTDDRRRELGKTKHWQSGLSFDLYPLHVLREQTKAVIAEGEADALLLCQMGFAALSGTLGAGNWKEQWTDALAGMERVTIWYDRDKAGQEGAEKVAASLCRVVPDVRILRRKIV
jgi:DNA primase